MENFKLSPTETTFFIIIIWSALGFFFYYFLSKNERWWSRKAEKEGLPEMKSVYSVLFQRLMGVLFLGLLPLLYLIFFSGKELSDFGVSAVFLKPIPWWTWLLLAGLVVLSYFNAASPFNLANYPMIRVKNWSRTLVLLSALSWIAYLLSYEFFFRGLLLYSTLMVIGPWPAIGVNIALYAFAHLFKGAGETFGALPLGVVFCLLTIITGNIWCVVILHITMALSNEWFSLFRQPEMKLIKRW